MNQSTLSRNELFTILTIVSVNVMLLWTSTTFYDGMFIYLFQYWIIIIPLVILYLITLIGTLVRCIKGGVRKNKIPFAFHAGFVAIVLCLSLYNSEFFKSDIELKGVLQDDLFHYALVLREDGSCENEVTGFLGYQETYRGFYFFKGDTIIFTKKPYDNDFIPDTLFYNKKKQAIFLTKDKDGKFSDKKGWLNHFEIIPPKTD